MQQISQGDRFFRLTVVEFAGVIKGHRVWKCVCDCGQLKVIKGSSLRTGNTKSCGCFQKDAPRTHNMTGHPVYKCWSAMMDRCRNPRSHAYKDYGARGIRVCPRWVNALLFIEDMLPKWQKGMSLDRIDNDLGYCPENCRWATRKEQASNRRSSVLVSYRGETLTLEEASRRAGLWASTVKRRMSRGVDESLWFTPVKPKG